MNTSDADLVIAGEQRAARVLERIERDTAEPDLLYREALAAWSSNGDPGLRGFLRVVSKRLERLPA